tara:strand:+ start:485 stop:1768 length:1284 start_codon:yes stop_codon:yes gene_type:complete
MGKKKTILFTDPASLGGNGYYSSTGDVDDLACIIYMSQQLKDNLTVVICDDKTGQRYSSFIDLIGQQLKTNYGIKTLTEVELSDILSDTDIYIHAPILDSTAQILSNNIENINNVCTQGDDTAVNFKNSQGAKKFISNFREQKNINLHRYDTTETNFTLSYNPEFQNTLTVPDVSKIYKQYFLFQQRKSFGTALGIGFLCNRLYSNTGFKGGPGNGINDYQALIQTLKVEKKLPEIKGELLKAFNNTVSHGECDESAIQNGKDLISLMNLYCNYENLIVDGKLPNMGNLGNVQKRRPVDERVSILFDIVPNFTSTPLFDFAAAYFSISGKTSDKSTLIQAAMKSLSELNAHIHSKTDEHGDSKTDEHGDSKTDERGDSKIDELRDSNAVGGYKKRRKSSKKTLANKKRRTRKPKNKKRKPTRTHRRR